MMIKQQLTKKLLLIDSNEVLQGLLCEFFLSQQTYQVMSLHDGNGLPALLNTSQVDLIVLDMALPSNEGFYWLKWLQHYYPYIPVIIVSIRNNQYERLAWLECGARDYVLKPFLCQELFIRVENVLAKGLSQKTEKLIQIGSLELDTQKNTLKKNGEEIKLTLMEGYILTLLYLNSGSPVSRVEIMAQVNTGMHNPFDRSVDIHINKLRKKIEDDPSTPMYIKTVRHRGYCLHVNKLKKHNPANTNSSVSCGNLSNHLIEDLPQSKR